MYYHGVDEKVNNRIDELERANAALQLRVEILDATLDALPDLMFEVDEQGIIHGFRTCHHGELYAPPAVFLGKKVGDVLPEKAAGAIEAALKDACERGYHCGTVYSLEMPQGDRWYELSMALRGEGASQGKRFIALARNVTGRLHGEKLLKDELTKKDRLLREIHHRLNNNLQTVSSLLAIQEQQIDDPVCRSSFSESRDRIRSIALIHELLYKSRDVASVDFRSYLNDLMPVLLDLYGRREITYVMDIRELHLPEGMAVPLALVVNELVSNALKHAFPGGREGTIYVRLHSPAPSSVHLVIRDDGIGFPENQDIQSFPSLGMKLVQGFVEQIGATMEIGRDNGTVFNIRLAGIE